MLRQGKLTEIDTQKNAEELKSMNKNKKDEVLFIYIDRQSHQYSIYSCFSVAPLRVNS